MCTGGCLLFLPCTAAKAAGSPVALASSSTGRQVLAPVLAVRGVSRQREAPKCSAEANSQSIVRTGGAEHCVQAQRLTDVILRLITFRCHLSAIF